MVSVEVQVAVEHTFIDCQCNERQSQPQFGSEPSLSCMVKASSFNACECEDSKYPEISTPTTCFSENGDQSDDLASLPDDASLTSEVLCSTEVHSFVKNTFIEFKPFSVDDTTRLRRSKSVPPSAKFEVFRTIKPLAMHAPASCASGHNQWESVESLCQERIQSWAECNNEEMEDCDKDGARKHRGGRVRSGRARQREARRRRMRTPSPEMRSYYSGNSF